MKGSKRGMTSLVAVLAIVALAGQVSAATTQARMPQGLWEAFSEARHRVEPLENAAGRTFTAQSPASHLVFRFGAEGFTVKPGTADREWSLTMRLHSYGQEGALVPAVAPELQAEGRRVELRRGPVTEWYVNEPRGLEQGFTLAKPEGYDPAKPVLITFALEGGLTPRGAAAGRNLSFHTKDGATAFDYKGLKAFDAGNKPLPATMAAADDGRLVISVAAGDATWPVTVDPVISTETKLVGANNDASNSDYFGNSVALDGDTALVGAFNDDDLGANSGSAYVFIRWADSWIYQAKLTAPDGAASDNFGCSVALSGDRAIVGAFGNGSNTGAAYVFSRSGDTWAQQEKLTALADAHPGDFFGSSVAISGNTVLVGAMEESSVGAAYVFIWTGAVWFGQQKLTAGDSLSGDRFGSSVALDGDTALVGARYHDLPAVDSGAAYVFTRSGTTWTQQAKLTASDAAASESFGVSVSLDTDTALVGASYKDGIGANSGAAYIFTLSGTTWTQQAKLTASDAATNERFGGSVALSGDTALVGADWDENEGLRGSAFVFTRSGAVWTQQGKLTASDAADNDQFGYSVALSGDTALVGALRGDSAAADTGSAYLFDKPAGGWADMTERQEITAVVTGAGDLFGRSVALSGDTALVGANYDDVGGNTDQGSVYVFARSGSVWAFQGQLIALDGAADDQFGYSVALSGDTALVGANGDDVGVNTDQGSAYVFTRSGTTWSQQAQLTAADGAANDLFGSSVALSGDTALVAASGDDVGANADQGSAYVFTRSGTTWSEQAQLTASDGAANDLFGCSVALSGDTSLVSTFRDDVGGNTDQGSAYVFTRSGTTWSEQVQLTASDGAANDWFGYRVALSGDTAFVGVFRTDVGGNTDQGSAYVFTRSGSAWFQQAQLTAADGAANDFFGSSVAFSGDTTLAGAFQAGQTDAGAAYLDRFDCGFGSGIVPGRWTMIGIPCDITGAATVQDVFGDTLPTSQYLTSWVVFKRDEANDRYARLGLGSTLQQGEGYWIYSANWATWDAAGSRTSYPVTSDLCASPKGCFEVPLTVPADGGGIRFNLVGHPGNQTTNWDGVNVLIDGATLMLLYEAEDAGYLEKNLWKYNGTGYDTYDDGTTPGMAGTLESQEGVWVKSLGGAFGHTVSLLIPDGTALGGPPEPPMGLAMGAEAFSLAAASFSDAAAPSSKKSSLRATGQGKPEKSDRIDEWYVRLFADASQEEMRDKNSVFGQMQGSDDGYDRRDLPELAPFSTPYLTVVFPHEDWADRAGNYSSDFHDADMGDSDQWVFEVHSDSAYRDVTLRWDSIKMVQSFWNDVSGRWEWTADAENDGTSVMAKMWLQDLDTGEIVKAVVDGVPQSLSFNMDGMQVRTFRWVYSKKGNKLPAAPAEALIQGMGRAVLWEAP